MRWVLCLVVVLLAACGAADDERTAGIATPAAARRASSGGADRAVRRACRAPRPSVEPEHSEATPPESRDPAEPPPGARVTGRVVDADGAPIEYADVVAFLGVIHVGGHADIDGRFDLAIEHPTGVVRCLAWARDRAVAVGPWLALRENDTADAGTLCCGVGARIEGRIVKPDDTNTWGCVSVDWTDAFDDETWALVRRCVEFDVAYYYPYPGHADRGFSFSGLPPGRYRLHAGDLSGAQTVTAPAADVRLVKPPSVCVLDVDLRVTEPDGTPVTDFDVSVERDGNARHAECSWIERDGGRVLHVTIDGGPSVKLSVTATDGRSAQTVIRAPLDGPVAIVLPRRESGRPLLSIRGTVTDGGRPLTWSRVGSRSGYPGIDGTRVTVEAFRVDDGSKCRSTDTNGDGSFTIEDVEEGAYRLWAYSEGAFAHADRPTFATTLVAADAGRGDVLIEMSAARSRNFRLVLPDGFARVDDFEASVAGPDGDFDCTDITRTGDSVAAIGLRENVAYSLSMRVRCGVVWSATTRVETFTAGEEPIELRISRGLRIDGVVLRGDGTPVVGAYVYAENAHDGHADAYCGIDGTFALTGLDAGPFTISVSAPGLSTGDSGVATYAGVRGLRIVLQPTR
jgi:hypothetical protein